MESVLKKLSAGKVDAVRKLASSKLKANHDDPEGWFLMGMVSHEKGNEGYALECFERALFLKRTEKYHKAKSMSHMGLFEFEDAADELKSALEFRKDAESHFMLYVALLFLNDNDAEEHLAAANRINPAKTRKKLREFFNSFFRDEPSIPEKEKKAMMKKLGIKSA
jgi:tetratricopeptide (TPR) repeat protein